MSAWLLASTLAFSSSFVIQPQSRQQTLQTSKSFLENSFQSPSSCSLISNNKHPSSYKMQLSSSADDEDDEPLSDELSKLIGKRASISSAKKPPAAESKPILSDNEENAIVDPSFEALYEGKSGMDIFEMPDFKTKRPLKTPKETEDKARGGDNKDGSSGGEYVDFMGDYEDENDLHIPNRIGISTDAWGDTDQGFKSGKKLKKKQIKAGKYLAGDLQVRCEI